MFKQFTENISGNQAYLLFSLCIFLLFFIVVSIMLIRIRKPHVDHMSQMPLNDNLIDQSKTSQQ
jgi:cbb3-type cytochrome oxidase subunit 3